MDTTTRVTVYLANKQNNKFNLALLGFLKENIAKFVTSGILFRIQAYLTDREMPVFDRLPAMTIAGEPDQYGVNAIQNYLFNLQLSLLRNTNSRTRKAIQIKDDDEKGSDDMNESKRLKSDMMRVMNGRQNRKPENPQTEIPEHRTTQSVPSAPRNDNISIGDDADDDGGMNAEEARDKKMMANYRRTHGKAGGVSDAP